MGGGALLPFYSLPSKVPRPTVPSSPRRTVPSSPPRCPKCHVPPSQVSRPTVPGFMSHRPKFHVQSSKFTVRTSRVPRGGRKGCGPCAVFEVLCAVGWVVVRSSEWGAGPWVGPGCGWVPCAVFEVLCERCCVLWDGWWCAPRSGVPALGARAQVRGRDRWPQGRCASFPTSVSRRFRLVGWCARGGWCC